MYGSGHIRAFQCDCEQSNGPLVKLSAFHNYDEAIPSARQNRNILERVAIYDEQIGCRTPMNAAQISSLSN